MNKLKKITLEVYHIKVEMYLLFPNLNFEFETKILGPSRHVNVTIIIKQYSSVFQNKVIEIVKVGNKKDFLINKERKYINTVVTND